MVDEKKLIELYKSGYSLQEIANKLNLGYATRAWQLIKPLYKLYNLEKYKRDVDGSPNPRKEEIYVFNKLKKLGLNPTYQGYNCPFDILVGDKKIEVKYRSRTDNREKYNNFWKFNYLIGREPSDYHVFVVGINKDRKCFIVPSDIIKNYLNIAKVPKNKNTKRFNLLYGENWKQIVDAVRCT